MSARTALVTLAFLLPLAGSAQAANESRPDLIVVDVWITDAQGHPADVVGSGSPLVVHGIVRNEGSGVAGRSTVLFLIDGATRAQTTIDGLAPFEELAVHSASWTPAPGLHELTVQADARQKVIESSEDNNQRSIVVDALNTRLRIEADETAGATLPFESVTYELRIVDLASTSQTIRLKASGGGPGWAFRLANEHLEVPAGGSAVTTLTVVARPGGAPATITVEASPLDAPAIVESVSTQTLLMP